MPAHACITLKNQAEVGNEVMVHGAGEPILKPLTSLMAASTADSICSTVMAGAPVFPLSAAATNACTT